MSHDTADLHNRKERMDSEADRTDQQAGSSDVHEDLTDAAVSIVLDAFGVTSLDDIDRLSIAECERLINELRDMRASLTQMPHFQA